MRDIYQIFNVSVKLLPLIIILLYTPIIAVVQQFKGSAVEIEDSLKADYYPQFVFKN